MDDFVQYEAAQSTKPNRRLGNRKSKQGCLTCKARKVKCDETHPYCTRCKHSDRTCLGYGDVFVSTQVAKLSPTGHDRDRSRSRSRSQSQSPNTPSLVFSTSPETALPTYSDSSEARALQYYQSEIAAVLGGSIETSFWTKSILELSESEPAIRQALVAVSSLWEARMRTDVPDHYTTQQRSIEQYNKALALTAQRVAEPDAESVALSTCVLFLCMHYLDSDKEQAERLLRTGSGVLQTVLQKAWRFAESSPSSTAATFLPIFERMLLLLRLFGIGLPQFRSRDTMLHFDYQFANLDDARGTLFWLISESHDLISETATYRRDVRDARANWDQATFLEAKQRQQLYLDAFTAWEVGFRQLCDERLAFSLANEMYKSTLRLTLMVITIWVSCCFDVDEGLTDRFQEQYETVVNEAGKVIAYSMAAAKTNVPFTFEMGLIAPLYLVALKCRDFNLRHRALSLLSRAPAREGLWKREEALRVAQRVVHIETSGTEVVAHGIVFQNARISDTQTKFSDHRGIHITLSAKLHGSGEIWLVWDELVPLYD